jgi:acyl carrier protein
MPTPSTTEIILAWLRSLPTSSALETVATETELIDQGVVDSIAILDLIAFLEDRFSFVLPLEEFVPENFRTADGIARMVARLSGGSAE